MGVPLGCPGTVPAVGWGPGARAEGRDGRAGNPNRSPGGRAARLPGLREAGSHGDQARREAGGRRQASLYRQPLARAASLPGRTLLASTPSGSGPCGVRDNRGGLWQPRLGPADARLASGHQAAPRVRRLGSGRLRLAG